MEARKSERVRGLDRTWEHAARCVADLRAGWHLRTNLVCASNIVAAMCWPGRLGGARLRSDMNGVGG